MGSYLEHRGSCVRTLFVDLSSAFNTVIPGRFVTKLTTSGLSPSICKWIMDFLTNRPQRGRIGALVSSQLPLSAGAPQGCVLSSLLYSLSITAVPPPTLPTPSSGMRTTQPLFVPSQGGGGGPQTGGVVQGQQPHPEHFQDKGNNHGLS